MRRERSNIGVFSRARKSAGDDGIRKEENGTLHYSFQKNCWKAPRVGNSMQSYEFERAPDMCAARNKLRVSASRQS
jgi:hypothetical protein